MPSTTPSTIRTGQRPRARNPAPTPVNLAVAAPDSTGLEIRARGLVGRAGVPSGPNRPATESAWGRVVEAPPDSARLDLEGESGVEPVDQLTPELIAVPSAALSAGHRNLVTGLCGRVRAARRIGAVRIGEGEHRMVEQP